MDNKRDDFFSKLIHNLATIPPPKPCKKEKPFSEKNPERAALMTLKVDKPIGECQYSFFANEPAQVVRWYEIPSTDRDYFNLDKRSPDYNEKSLRYTFDFRQGSHYTYFISGADAIKFRDERMADLKKECHRRGLSYIQDIYGIRVDLDPIF